MNALLPDTEKYARCIRASKAVRWDIDNDVIKGRSFDRAKKYLPDGLSLVQELPTLSDAEKRFASQVQGRTYANVFGLVERFITAKLLEVGHQHSLGDQNALEALVRFSDEEIKHQTLFRRINDMMGATLPAGYRFDVDPDAVAQAVLSKSTWAVLVLTLHIELFVQDHYRRSIEPDGELSDLFKDVFLFHWRDESTHVVLDELELRRHDATLTREERDRAVDDFIALVDAVDGILQTQAKADAAYFAANCGRAVPRQEADRLEEQFLKAYRWQYIFSGAAHPRFQSILKSLITEAQAKRIEAALATIQ
jgi:P-aminobenzoate N-oxygenase AurF